MNILFSLTCEWLLSFVSRLYRLSVSLGFLAAILTVGCRHCRLVGSSGVEPPTSCLSGMRSNLLSYEPVLFAHFRNSPLIFGFIPLELHISVFSTDGGDEGIRTLDPLLAGQVLSQLSYTPKGIFPTVPGNRTTTISNFVLRRLFCFFVSYERSYFNLSCSP